MQAKDNSIRSKDVYEYEGITDCSPIDEVYTETKFTWDAETRTNLRTEVEKVRLSDEYAHLGQLKA